MRHHRRLHARRNPSFLKSSYARRLRAEQLEDRRMLAGVTVGNTTDLVNAPDTSSIAALITNDGGDGISLREAIAATNNTSGADTITFDASLLGQTIHLSAAGNELTITDSVTIDGDINDDGVADITIDADSGVGLDDADSRIFTIDDGDGVDATTISATLEGLTLQDGDVVGNGGAVFIPGDNTLTIRSSSVLNNTARMVNETIAEGMGGGIFGGGSLFEQGNVIVENSVISGNQAFRGGGVYHFTGNITLTGSSVTNNAATDDGGGINTITAEISESTISGNTSGGIGGGFFVVESLTLTNSLLSNNTASTYGGGAHLVGSDFGSQQIINSTITGNSSANGGGIFVSIASVLIEGSTITGNMASEVGGGIGLSPLDFGIPQPVTIRNSIVAGNSDDGTAPDLRSVFDPANNLVVEFSLVGDTTGAGLDLGVSNNNLTGVDPLLGPLADNGGPTLTHALLVGSPAIDQGNTTQTTDQRSFIRPIDFSTIANATGGNGSDIGAFELQPETPSLIVTTAADVVDNADFVTSLREAINFANSQTGVDTITFDASVFNGEAADVIRLQLGQLTISESVNIDAGTLDVVISADASGDDTLVAGTFITDIAASQAAGTLADNNGRVLQVTAPGGSSVQLTGLTLTGGNVTGSGGGIVSSYAPLDISNATIAGNVASGSGGGIFAAVTLTDSTISGNQSGQSGGGIASASGAITLNRSTISGNSSSANGGGVSTDSGTLNVAGSTVSGNQTTGNYGGGLFGGNTSTVTIDSSTITNNTSTVNGGGVVTFGATTFNNSILAGNIAPGGAADAAGTGSNFSGDFNLLGFSDGIAGTGNVGGVPDPGLGPLADNGGPTLTHALLPGSPAIDAGNSTLTTDQRGFARPADQPTIPNAAGGNGSDIGATELQELPSLIVTTNIDVVAEDGVTSLREAINFANSQSGADTITFDASLSGAQIDLPGNTELVVTDTLTIDASALPEGVTIDAQNNSRVLNFSAASGDLTLNNLTLQNGNSLSYDGGGILFSSNGLLTLTSSTVSGNSTTGSYASGGGISTSTGNVTLTGSTVSGNFTTGRFAGGGGIFTSTGNVTLNSSTVSGNSVSGDNASGVGVYTRSGNVTLNSSTINGNSSTGTFADGGGVFTSYGNVTLTGSTVSENTSGFAGGGVFNLSGDVTLTSSTVSGNTSGDDGGGIYTRSGNVTLTSSTVSGNTSGDDGGGIYFETGAETVYSRVTVDNSTITQNSAGGVGGGIGFIADGNESLIVRNSIIAGNTDNGTAPDFLAPQNASDLTVEFSLIGTNAGTTLTAAPVGSPDANGSLIGGTGSNVIDPLLGTLADNGGPTLTHALLPGSPATDAGNSTLTTDQRGLTRPIDQPTIANAAGGNGNDIGAFELQTEAPSLIVTTATDVVDNTDFVTSLREAIDFANSTAGADTITFDASLLGQTIHLSTDGSLIITDSITIDGDINDDDVADITIDADSGAGLDDADTAVIRVFGAGNETILDGLIVRDGNSLSSNGAGFGGGIQIGSGAGNLTLINSSVLDSTADQEGGGIHIPTGNLVLAGSTVSGNSATGSFADGGGVFTNSGDVTLMGSTVSGNSSNDDGGGIYTSTGNVTLNSSTVSENTSGRDGGGISTSTGNVTLNSSSVSGNSATGSSADGGGISTSSGNVTLNSSIVSGNSSNDDGGGIETFTGSVTLNSSTVSGNSSENEGGGISTSSGNVTLTSSTVSGNSSGDDGGGIYTDDSTVLIESSTIAGNTAGETGGGIGFFADDAGESLTIRNSIIAGNTGGAAPDFLAPGDPSSNRIVEFSLIGDNTGTGLTESQTAGADGNLIGSAAGAGVIDPLLGDLANNGGPTLTHALLTGSPALNAGNNVLLPADTNDLDGDGDTTEAIPFDQRGVGFDRVFGPAVDIGAFEQQFLSGDFNRDLVVSAADFVSFRDTIGASLPPGEGADGDGDGAVTAADFNVFVANFGADATPPATLPASPATVAAVAFAEPDEPSLAAQAVLILTPSAGAVPTPPAGAAESFIESPAEAVDDGDLLLTLAYSSAEEFGGFDRSAFDELAFDESAFDEAFASEEDEADGSLALALSSL